MDFRGLTLIIFGVTRFFKKAGSSSFSLSLSSMHFHEVSFFGKSNPDFTGRVGCIKLHFKPNKNFNKFGLARFTAGLG